MVYRGEKIGFTVIQGQVPTMALIAGTADFSSHDAGPTDAF